MFGRLSFAVIVLVICTVSLLSTVKSNTRSVSRSEVHIFSALVRIRSARSFIQLLVFLDVPN